MTTELKRLKQALGTPDLQLREIQREQRLMEAANRWSIVRDVAPEYAPPERAIHVNLDVRNPETDPEPAIIRLQTKTPETAQPEAETAKAKGPLASVFSKLKRQDDRQSG